MRSWLSLTVVFLLLLLLLEYSEQKLYIVFFVRSDMYMCICVLRCVMLVKANRCGARGSRRETRNQLWLHHRIIHFASLFSLSRSPFNVSRVLSLSLFHSFSFFRNILFNSLSCIAHSLPSLHHHASTK